MADYNKLLKVMKKAGTEATNAECPVIICFGKVVSKSPLKINVDQKITLGSAQLVLTRNVTDYDVEIDVEWETEETKINIEVEVEIETVEPEEGEQEKPDTSVTNEAHKHNIKGKKKIKIRNSLKAGDEVVLLRQQGGQKYIVVDKVV